MDAPPTLPCPHDAATLKDGKGKSRAKQQVFEVMPSCSIGDVVKGTKIMPGQSEEEFRTLELETFRTSERSRTRLPRGVVPKAVSYLRARLTLPDTFTSETLRGIHGKFTGNNNIALWQEVVDTMCDEVWDASLLQAGKERDAKRWAKTVKSKEPSQSRSSSTREPDQKRIDMEKEALIREPGAPACTTEHVEEASTSTS
ncbi:hypothetical protein EC968_006491 [Mortierella alpina]|nr:hypothetical protein EC968_006491 [Mortierella alpina]